MSKHEHGICDRETKRTHTEAFEQTEQHISSVFSKPLEELMDEEENDVINNLRTNSESYYQTKLKEKLIEKKMSKLETMTLPSNVERNDVKLIVAQTNCSIWQAIQALQENDNDIIGAIVALVK